MAEEIRASLNIDLNLAQLRNAARQADDLQTRTDARRKRIIDDLRRTEAEANALERRIESKLKTFGKQIGRTAALSAATIVASSFDIPEAARPAANIATSAGFAALSGGPAIGLLYGLAATVGELVTANRNLNARVERFQESMERMRLQTVKIEEDIQAERVALEAEIEKVRREARREAIEEARELDYETWQLMP